VAQFAPLAPLKPCETHQWGQTRLKNPGNDPARVGRNSAAYCAEWFYAVVIRQVTLRQPALRSLKGVIMRYMVVVEKGETRFGAFVPDLPGCVAVGETEEEVVS